MAMAARAMKLIGHRIVAAWVERMATKDPSRTKPASAQDSEAFDRLHGVTRATRIEAATLTQ